MTVSIEEDVDDFLEHHGVKGMKWGQKRAARKVARQAERSKAFDARTKSLATDTKSFRANRADIRSSQAVGYSKGKATAISLLGGTPGTMLANELKIRKNVRETKGPTKASEGEKAARTAAKVAVGAAAASVITMSLAKRYILGE